MAEERPLIEPRRIPGDPKITFPLLLVLFGPYMDILRKETGLEESAGKRLRFPSLDYYETSLQGRRFAFAGTPLGAPHAAIALERFIAMGAREILAFGCCGSLQPDLHVGHFVVPTEALSEEGTSAHYPLAKGIRAKADGQIVRLLKGKCQEKNCKTAAGKVWTTDALFRETGSKVKRYSARGLIAVEMEMSALFTIAAYRNVRLGGLMVVADELARLKWKPGFLNPLFWSTSQKAARVVIEACLDL